jgi:predicted AAA+ superfamily ATPase
MSIEKNLKESLAGRFELIKASHWNFQEYQRVFDKDLQSYIEFGCYPGAVSYLPDLERWSEYIKDSIVEPAIGRDILQIHPIENPALLRHVFALALKLPAQIISLNKMQGQLQDKGAIATIQHYLNLLNSAYLISGVQKFSQSGFRLKNSSPKIIIHNNSLLRAFERPVAKKIDSAAFGFYFENTIGARMIEANWNVQYWKDKNHEVDFIVENQEGEKLAIEVKSAKTEASELKSLLQFCKLNEEFEPCLISLIDQKIAGIRSLDAQQILSLSANSVNRK